MIRLHGKTSLVAAVFAFSLLLFAPIQAGQYSPEIMAQGMTVQAVNVAGEAERVSETMRGKMSGSCPDCRRLLQEFQNAFIAEFTSAAAIGDPLAALSQPNVSAEEVTRAMFNAVAASQEKVVDKFRARAEAAPSPLCGACSRDDAPSVLRVAGDPNAPIRTFSVFTVSGTTSGKRFGFSTVTTDTLRRTKLPGGIIAYGGVPEALGVIPPDRDIVANIPGQSDIDLLSGIERDLRTQKFIMHPNSPMLAYVNELTDEVLKPEYEEPGFFRVEAPTPAAEAVHGASPGVMTMEMERLPARLAGVGCEIVRLRTDSFSQQVTENGVLEGEIQGIHVFGDNRETEHFSAYRFSGGMSLPDGSGGEITIVNIRIALRNDTGLPTEVLADPAVASLAKAVYGGYATPAASAAGFPHWFPAAAAALLPRHAAMYVLAEQRTNPLSLNPFLMGYNLARATDRAINALGTKIAQTILRVVMADEHITLVNKDKYQFTDAAFGLLFGDRAKYVTDALDIATAGGPINVAAEALDIAAATLDASGGDYRGLIEKTAGSIMAAATDDVMPPCLKGKLFAGIQKFENWTYDRLIADKSKPQVPAGPYNPTAPSQTGGAGAPRTESMYGDDEPWTPNTESAPPVEAESDSPAAGPSEPGMEGLWQETINGHQSFLHKVTYDQTTKQYSISVPGSLMSPAIAPEKFKNIHFDGQRFTFLPDWGSQPPTYILERVNADEYSGLVGRRKHVVTWKRLEKLPEHVAVLQPLLQADKIRREALYRREEAHATGDEAAKKKADEEYEKALEDMLKLRKELEGKRPPSFK